MSETSMSMNVARGVALVLTLVVGCQEGPYAKEIAALQGKDEAARAAALEDLRKAGPAARAAVPALKKLVEQKDFAAAATLAYVDPSSAEAARVLIERLTRDDRDPFAVDICTPPLVQLGEVGAVALGDALNADKPQQPILRVLLALGPNGKPAGPKLVAAIQRQKERGFKSPQEGMLLHVAGAIGADPKVVVPIAVEVMKKLGTRDAASGALNGLIAYGPAAKETLPFLRTLHGQDGFTDRWIATAVLKIDPQDAKARGILIQGLPGGGNAANAEAARQALIENGKLAIPDLEKAIADPATPKLVKQAAKEVLDKLRSR